MTSIVQSGDEGLRTKATPVPEDMFGSPLLAQYIKEMAESLDAEKDGVALAAPQISIPYRIFIARPDRLLPPEEGKGQPVPEVIVFINPEITRSSKRRLEVDEGCLSVRSIYGKTMRHERATVCARTVDGSAFQRGGGGIMAQIYQHEIDHLDGILFTDHATDLIEVTRAQGAEAVTIPHG